MDGDDRQGFLLIQHMQVMADIRSSSLHSDIPLNREVFRQDEP